MEDIIMRKLAALILVAVATVSQANVRHGQYKQIEVQPTAVAGNYSGPSESYGLVIEVAPDGALRGNYVEMGSVAVLNAIAVHGSEFTARASFDDGTLRLIRGSFIREGSEGAFGLQLHAVPVEDVGMVDTFFEKF
jgi:hypothetical protein